MTSSDETQEIPVDFNSLKEILAGPPFHEYFKFELLEVDTDAGVLQLRIPYHPGLNRMPVGKQIHGGVIAVLIDVAATFAVAAKTRKPAATVDLRIDYLRPGSGSSLIATATVRRSGKTLSTADVDVTDEEENLIASGRGTFLTK